MHEPTESRTRSREVPERPVPPSGTSAAHRVPHRTRGRPDRHRPFRAFDHHEFRLLFLAGSIGDAGFWISYISLQWLMARLTDANPGWLGVLFFCNFIPMLLLAPVAGVIADRTDRRRILVATRVVLAALSFALAALTAADRLRPLIVVAFGSSFGAMFAFMAPAGQAVLANAVPAGDLASAVSLQAAGTNLTRVAGPASAAPILSAWGAQASFALYAALNLTMALVVRRIAFTPQQVATATTPLIRQIREGIDHARERSPAGTVLLALAIFSVFGASHVSMYPVIARRVLGRGGSSFTALVSMSGAGAVLGALLISARRRVPTLHGAAVQLAGFATALLAFAASRSWSLSVALAGVLGFFYFAYTTSLNILLQHLADDDKRGRLMSLFTIAWAGVIPFGGLVLGALAGSIGVPAAIAVGAGVCLVTAALLIARPSGDHANRSRASEHAHDAVDR